MSNFQDWVQKFEEYCYDEHRLDLCQQDFSNLESFYEKGYSFAEVLEQLHEETEIAIDSAFPEIGITILSEEEFLPEVEEDSEELPPDWLEEVEILSEQDLNQAFRG